MQRRLPTIPFIIASKGRTMHDSNTGNILIEKGSLCLKLPENRDVILYGKLIMTNMGSYTSSSLIFNTIHVGDELGLVLGDMIDVLVLKLHSNDRVVIASKKSCSRIQVHFLELGPGCREIILKNIYFHVQNLKVLGKCKIRPVNSYFRVDRVVVAPKSRIVFDK